MPGDDELLRLTLSRPRDALAEAARVLASRPDDVAASYAWQARGIVLRDLGRYTEAVRDLRLALRLARRCGVPHRVPDVQATLGLALAFSGRTAAGLSALDDALAASDGNLAGRVLMRRGFVLARVGRRAEALGDLNRAIVLLHRAGDGIWEGRARTSRFIVYAIAGEAARAYRDLDVAERIYLDAGQEFEAATVSHNRAEIAAQEGDLPAALAYLDETGQRYAALGVDNIDLTFDRCRVLLAAGLADEALDVADAEARRLADRPADRAVLIFAAACAAQAAGRPAEAAARASAARDMFRRQRRSWWAARAAFVLVQSRYDTGARDGRTRLAAHRIADQLDELGAEEAPAAHLLAGRLATLGGRPAETDRHLERAARLRRHGPTHAQAAGWLAQAMRAEARGATAAALRACRRGLNAAAGHQQRLGAVELRAHAAAYGTELAAIGQRHARRRNDAGMLLLWSERWRAGALAPIGGRPPDDRELDADLAALRAVMSRLDDARAAGRPTGPLDADRRRLEQTIRSRTRRNSGRSPIGPGPAQAGRAPAGSALVGRASTGSAMAGSAWEGSASEGPASEGSASEGSAPAGVGEIVDGLGDHLLIELIAVDGTLYAVTVRSRRTRLHEVGPMAEAVRELELARFTLRRLARGRPPPGSAELLAETGRRLEATLLGSAVSELDDRPTVLVPAAALHAVPWAMLPSLRTVAWGVAPSAATWLAVRRRPAHPRGGTVIVVGPGLPGTRAEAASIAAGYRNPTVLANGTATAARVLAAVDGARTAHIAAHGVFRADSPLFSSMRLDDGPLNLHDLGRLRRGPERMILSSCDSAVALPVAGDELLGMISVLIPLGTASMLASVVPVNDAAAAPLMTDFHAGLRAGKGFADALLYARTRVPADPVREATALAFVALGR
ncbi:MAG TPA: CHAT domain-containing protein [Actinoplanes sp.]